MSKNDSTVSEEQRQKMMVTLEERFGPEPLPLIYRWMADELADLADSGCGTMEATGWARGVMDLFSVLMAKSACVRNAIEYFRDGYTHEGGKNPVYVLAKMLVVGTASNKSDLIDAAQKLEDGCGFVCWLDMGDYAGDVFVAPGYLGIMDEELALTGSGQGGGDVRVVRETRGEA